MKKKTIWLCAVDIIVANVYLSTTQASENRLSRYRVEALNAVYPTNYAVYRFFL